jgi:hypothetical protein
MASSLCEIPMPSRTTRKSTRPEPQIDPWLPTCNRRACQFQKPIGVVATKRRWSWDGITRDLTQDQRAKRQNRTPRIADRGWKSRKSFSTSGQGRKMFLTSPLIDQALTLIDHGAMSENGDFTLIDSTSQPTFRAGRLGQLQCVKRAHGERH